MTDQKTLTFFLSTKDALETYGHSDIEWFKRLDWSEIEVEE